MGLIERLETKADLCANEGANDIAALLWEAAAALALSPSAPPSAQAQEPTTRQGWLHLLDMRDSEAWQRGYAQGLKRATETPAAQAAPPAAVEATTEVRLNDDGTLDEVVGSGAFHLEQMDANHWFLQVGSIAVWLRAKGKITATSEHRLPVATPAAPAQQDEAVSDERVGRAMDMLHEQGYRREDDYFVRDIGDGEREVIHEDTIHAILNASRSPR